MAIKSIEIRTYLRWCSKVRLNWLYVDKALHVLIEHVKFLGISSTLEQYPGLRELDSCEELTEIKTKDTGQTKKLQKWTRELWICASGSGPIGTEPLY